MQTLICGSLAFDTIMVFPDRFKNHILPEKIHMLSVAFLVPEMRREWGGTAGNIAYNLKLLGGDPLIMATVGDDFPPYADRLDALGISRDCVRVVPGTYTAQAFITTDMDDNQITAFHPGAMNFSHLNRISDAPNAKFGVIAPDGRDGMLQHAREFAAAGISYLFDPGQGLPMLTGEEILAFLEGARFFAVNDYEAQLLTEKTGLSLEQLAGRVEAAIVTRGASGSTILVGDGTVHIPAVKPDAVVDPTGCGDAYRAGLLYGISQGWSWERTGQLASLMGSIKIAARGGQNHHPDREELASRYRAAFGEDLF
jgi:adenosine kinase